MSLLDTRMSFYNRVGSTGICEVPRNSVLGHCKHAASKAACL